MIKSFKKRLLLYGFLSLLFVIGIVFYGVLVQKTALLYLAPSIGLLVFLLVMTYDVRRTLSIVTQQIMRFIHALSPPFQCDAYRPTGLYIIDDCFARLYQKISHLQTTFEDSKRFSADSAHELKTPLAALKTHAQVAMKAGTESEKVKALEQIIQNADRCSHLLTQLLILNRIYAENTAHYLKPIDLYLISTEVIAELAPQALCKSIDLSLAPKPAQTIIFGNEVALSILVRNIVDNAIRYTKSHGTIDIALLNEKNNVIFQIIDSGPGIDPALRARVFERFFRIIDDQTTGSGLGLSIVKQIAEKHHATIDLKTPVSGIGLQVDIRFPREMKLLYNKD